MLITLAGLLAPFVPFTSEELWRNLQAWREGAAESVHMSDYPAGDTSLIDKQLEEQMDFVREVVALGRAARNRVGLKVRQPLSVMKVVTSSPGQEEALHQLETLILEEMNVKQVESVGSSSSFMVLQAQPHFSSLGPKHGGEVNRIAEAVRSMSQHDLHILQEGGDARLTLDGEEIVIEPGDVILEEVEPEGLVVEREGEVTVAVDSRLDEALIQEGLAREFTTRVQNFRRQIGYEVTDRIRLGYQASPKLETAIEAHAGYITGEALAVEMQKGLLDESDHQVDWSIDEESVTISIVKA